MKHNERHPELACDTRVLTVATTTAAPKDIFGLAIGSAIVVGGYASAKVSGGNSGSVQQKTRGRIGFSSEK